MFKLIHFRKTLCFALVCIIGVVIGSATFSDTFADDPPLPRMVSIQYDGGIRPFIVDPQGRMSGINTATQAVEYGIPDTEIFFGTDNGSIRLNTLIDGTYTVSAYGIYEEDYKIEIIYMDENEKMMDIEFQGFHHKNKDVTPFTFTMDEDNLETPLILNHLVPSPHDLLADPIEDQGLKTKLTWTASADPEVIGYNIYHQSLQKPFFKKLDESADNQYQTDQAWSADAAIAPTRYAVTAIKQDGTESFFSNVETNNDRDHDWLIDETETKLGTDLNNPDTDDDQLTDFLEYNNHHTDPTNPDTDGDTYTDGEEVQADSNPRDADSVPGDRIPSIEIIQPDTQSDTADDSYTITWTDRDSDDDAQIALYYDTDNIGQDGTLIIENLSEDDETDLYIWDTTQITEGNYYIYAVISDQSNGYTVAYSTGSIAIDKTTPTIDLTAPILTTVSIASDNADPAYAKVGDTVTLSFTADEEIQTPPTVMIDGNAAVITDMGGNDWTATRLMQTGDTAGVIAFTIDFVDLAGNTGAQVTITTSPVTEVTFDETDPSATLFSPEDNETGVDVDTDLVITFSENVQAGAGNIIIKKSADDSVVATIPVGDAQVTFVGNTVTINPTADLTDSTSHYVIIDAGAITDLAGNPYAGITDKSTWNFMTVFGANGGNIITLESGWNVFSTPRELSSIEFFNGGTDINFYKLEGGTYASTTTAATVANIKPLEGFLVNNASGAAVDVYLDYTDGITGQGLKTFTKELSPGWNLIGVANQSFEANDSDYTEISIKNALSNIINTGSIIDYTTINFAGGDNNNKVDASGEIFSKPTTDTEKFEEFKAYLVSIPQGGASYTGSQKDNEPLV